MDKHLVSSLPSERMEQGSTSSRGKARKADMSLTVISAAESISNDTVNIMNFSKVAFILILGGVGAHAFADESHSTSAASKPLVENYVYGTKLDIKKIITVTGAADQCGPVPAQMTYEDSQGQQHVLQYQTMGTGCSSS
ncbi:hypothetical protein D3C84_1003450 [compost metagenome]